MRMAIAVGALALAAAIGAFTSDAAMFDVAASVTAPSDPRASGASAVRAAAVSGREGTSAAAVSGAAPASSAVATDTSPVLAPGYFDLEYPAPAPGTYALPPLRAAADGELIDEHGAAHRLYDYFGDKVVLLSFIYTTCSDVNGCPLASFVLKRVQDRALADPDVRNRLRIVSVSFDPAHDTPAAIAAYADHVRAPGFDWVFLTSASNAAIQPLLDRYDQAVFRDDSGAISHILRVMLIDRQRRVRNIYSVSFLHPDTVLADVRTLLLEASPASMPSPVPASSDPFTP